MIKKPRVTKSGRAIHAPTPYAPSVTTPRRRGPYRRLHEASVCKTCRRGPSPRGNQIVFCDACNGAWHQCCHTPRIPDAVVVEEEREWVCSGCHNGENTVDDNKVGALRVPVTKQRRYLESLDQRQLVEMVLQLTTSSPDIKVFPVSLQSSSLEEEADAESYVDDTFYPAPGEGVRLPPESEDLVWLVDDDFAVFSHVYHDAPPMAMEGIEVSA
jgi:hypothetical protein